MVRQLIRVERYREYLRRKQIVKTETEVVYFLRNHPASARMVAQQIHTHWRIENHLHRQRDVLLDQDHCTIRLGTASQIVIACRDLVLSPLYRCPILNHAAVRPIWQSCSFSLSDEKAL